MARSYAAAAASAFRTTLVEIGVRGAEGPERLGRRAALLVAAEGAWGRHLGPLLDLKQIQELLGVGSRQAVSDLVRRGRLLRLPRRDGASVFPAFQLGESGRPLRAMPRILAAFADAAESPWTVASWFVTRQPLLGGMTPAVWLREGRDEDKVVEAARRSAERLRR